MQSSYHPSPPQTLAKITKVLANLTHIYAHNAAIKSLDISLTIELCTSYIIDG